ncbi:hypothetical protein D3C81_450420 [compost metagenome]
MTQNHSDISSSLSRKMAEKFTIENDCLTIGGIPLPRLAQQIGQTPFFAYLVSL